MLLKQLVAAGFIALSLGAHQANAQIKPTYMQIFYEGEGWLADRPVLHYSPAFRGKTGEIVVESDSTKVLAPGATLFSMPNNVHNEVTVEATTFSTNGVMYVRGKDGKMRPETAADIQRARMAESARFTRNLNLLAARAALARTALLNALNATATDGWEVVEMTSWKGKDGLVYLLRKR